MNYPGGKGGVYQRLINLMPHHEVYIETHLGGGAVMRNKRPARYNIGIEIDLEVIRMWTSDLSVRNRLSASVLAQAGTQTGNRVDRELIHGDAVDFLKEYRYTGKELVYCDPPYIRETRKKYYPLYKYEYTYEQHVELLEVIKGLPCMVMISGYRSELYTESLKDWHIHSFRAATHNGTALECLWMNYSPPEQLHDYRYLGSTFRKRERIKRKSKRWVAKLKSMPVLERQALLSAIHLVCR